MGTNVIEWVNSDVATKVHNVELIEAILGVREIQGGASRKSAYALLREFS